MKRNAIGIRGMRAFFHNDDDRNRILGKCRWRERVIHDREASDNKCQAAGIARERERERRRNKVFIINSQILALPVIIVRFSISLYAPVLFLAVDRARAFFTNLKNSTDPRGQKREKDSEQKHQSLGINYSSNSPSRFFFERNDCVTPPARVPRRAATLLSNST